VVRGIDGLSGQSFDGRDAVPGSRPRLELRLEKLPEGHPSAPDVARDTPRVAYYERIPQLELMWSRHLERWAERPGTDDGVQRDDPPGSWRGDGERFLDSERSAEANRCIAALQSCAEGITETLKGIEWSNTCGGTLAGLENCLKGADRIKEKIWDRLQVRDGLSVAEAAGHVKDAVRYTFVFEADVYVHGYAEVTEGLEAAGCRMTYGKNDWLANSEYKGVNTRWVTPDGSRFELQFHTPESLDAKESRTHRAYERLRSVSLSRTEEEDLRAYQHYVTAAVPSPADIESIGRHKEET
jgi:hypothetical protein